MTPRTPGTRAVVLAGGRGTRLWPYTTTIPKPLMPVGDRPILDVVLQQLHHFGFGRVTIATGHLAELLEAYAGDGTRYRLAVDYHREDEPLGTVGALASIEGLQDEAFLVMNGDVLTDLDYREFLQRHRASGAVMSIATRVQHVEVSLGVLALDDPADPQRITDFVEKPQLNFTASMGVYALDPSVLGHIEPGVHLDLPDLVLRLVRRGFVVRADHSDAYWLDIGRPQDYEQAQTDFEALHDRLLPPAA